MTRKVPKQTKPSTFTCDGCGSEIKMAVYAVAQLAMGNVTVFTHRKEDGGCGTRTTLEP